jgi:hypothetical protein
MSTHFLALLASSKKSYTALFKRPHNWGNVASYTVLPFLTVDCTVCMSTDTRDKIIAGSICKEKTVVAEMQWFSLKNIDLLQK